MSFIVKLLDLYKNDIIKEDQFIKLNSLYNKIIALSDELKITDLKEIDSLLDKTLEIKQINKTLEQIEKIKFWDYYFLENLFSKLDLFKRYPYVIMDTFYSHPNEEGVTFIDNKRNTFSENLPISLYSYLPGSFSLRWNNPRKILSGNLTSMGGVYLASNIHEVVDGEIIKKIPIKDLPNDYPLDILGVSKNENMVIIKPNQMKFQFLPYWWFKTAPGVKVCPECGKVPDGDEMREQEDFCPNDRQYLLNTRTVPDSYAKSWLTIDQIQESELINAVHCTLRVGKFDPPLEVPLPKIFNFLFSKIYFSEQLEVTLYYYELQRRYSTSAVDSISIYYKYYDQPAAFGTKITTDGLVFKYNKQLLQSYVDNILKQHNLEDYKSSLIQFIFHVNREALKNDLGYFDYNKIFNYILLKILQTNNYIVPENLSELQEKIRIAINDESEIISYLQSLTPELRTEKIELIIGKIQENKSQYDAVTLQEFSEFLLNLLVHSLSHALQNAQKQISGATEHGTGYFFDLDAEEIYVFDKIEGGSGFSETAKNYLYIPFSYRNACVRQRLGRFSLSPTFLPTSDFFTYFEEYMFECEDYTVTRILFEFCKKMDLSEVRELYLNPDKRSLFIEKINKKHSIMLRDQSIYLEYNIRNGTMLLLKYILKFTKIKNYQDIFALNLTPQLVHNILSTKLPNEEILSLLKYQEATRQIQEVEDMLSLCYAVCPSCLLPSSCIYGYFEPKFYINQRLLNQFYQYIHTSFTHEISEKNYEDKIDKIKESILKQKMAYLYVDYSEDALDLVSPLIGIRDGKEFKVIMDEDSETIYATNNCKYIKILPDLSSIDMNKGDPIIPMKVLVKMELS